MTLDSLTIPTSVKVVAAAVATAAWPFYMATEVNPSPIQVAGITAVALLAVKALTDVAAKLIKRQPSSHQADNANLRDMMVREFAGLKSRLDTIDAEVRINRERYHDLAGVLSTVAAEMKLVLAGRIKVARNNSDD
jgi:hypothetical protein